MGELLSESKVLDVVSKIVKKEEPDSTDDISKNWNAVKEQIGSDLMVDEIERSLSEKKKKEVIADIDKRYGISF